MKGIPCYIYMGTNIQAEVLNDVNKNLNFFFTKWSGYVDIRSQSSCSVGGVTTGIPQKWEESAIEKKVAINMFFQKI